MDPAKVNAIFRALTKAIPNPRTELVYHSNFELLIAVILSAHTTDVSVNKATAVLFKIANTPEKIFKLGESKLKHYIKSIGLYNAKAKNIIKACELLITKHKSRIPGTREELEELPGVGRKTANVILNIVFKQPVLAVDTHIFRVANRTKLAVGKTPLIVEQKLTAIIPAKYKLHAHHLLVLHGRYVCRARKPLCPECPICEWCEYEQKTK
jgi:endonuclease III